MEKEKADLYGFINLYFPKLSEEKFETSNQQWSAWERFVDMLCMVSLVMKEETQPESLGRIGCLLNDLELVKALEPAGKVSFPHKTSVRAIFDNLLMRGEPAKGGEVFPLQSFLNMEILEPLEKLALILSLCVDRNRKYERIFGVLQEENGSFAKPTVGFVHDMGMLFLDDAETNPGILLNKDSFLNRFLMEPTKEARYMSRISRPLSLRRQVVEIIMEQDVALGELSACGEILEPVDLDIFITHREEFERLLLVFTGMVSLAETGIIRLEGNAGIGRKYIVRALGSYLGMDVLCVHVHKLLAMEPEAMKEALTAAVLKVIAENAILYLEGISFSPEEIGKLQWVITFVQDYVRQVIVGVEEPWREEVIVKGVSYRIIMKTPGTKEQKQFWKYFAKEYLIEFAEDVNLDQLVSRYDMTPEKIRQTLLSASLCAPAGKTGFRVSVKNLEEEIRHRCSTELGRYAKRLESPFVWEDLQVSGESRQQLVNVCNRVRYRSVVNETFGFDRLVPYGRGTSVVLYGPPGTGKTMAAQVLAKELGLDIYRIDLSQIGSKYIGETEKNLGKVFDAARFSNAILFFDEADALFTKRTEVSSSNDRYANAETAYLLQKIEEYSGISILATNVMQNFDSAFKRRMTFMIPIEQPDAGTRLKLWQSVFPKDAPIDKEVDLEIYAQVAELTGSNIKSAALAAAYCAAAENRSINNKDLVEAVEFEYRRTGRTGISNELYGAILAQRSSMQNPTEDS